MDLDFFPVYCRSLISLVCRQPGDVGRLIENTGLQECDLDKMGLTISTADYQQLVENAERITGNDSIILELANKMPLSSHGLFGLACGVAPSRRQLLSYFPKVFRRRVGYVSVEIVDKGKDTELALKFDSTSYKEFGERMGEVAIFHMITLMKTLFLSDGAPYSSVEIWLRQPRPKNRKFVEQCLKAPVYYDKPSDAIYVSNVDLDAPLPCGDLDAFTEILDKCSEVSVRYGEAKAFVDTLENLFAHNPGKLWSINAAAKKLSISPRTLQRKLSRESTSYRDVQMNWLKRMAVSYLAKEKMGIAATAKQLGYSDEANFRRAFRRWFGCPVTEYFGDLV